MNKNMEWQVTSREWSQKLKELGVPQASAFWYEQVKIAGKNEWSKEWTLAFNNYSKPYSDIHIVSAFTVAELGEILRKGYISGKWQDPDTEGLWWAEHIDKARGYENKYLADTEANARAKSLCYLLENGLLLGEKMKEPISRRR